MNVRILGSFLSLNPFFGGAFPVVLRFFWTKCDLLLVEKSCNEDTGFNLEVFWDEVRVVDNCGLRRAGRRGCWKVRARARRVDKGCIFAYARKKSKRCDVEELKLKL
jgi:hypothetical protein